MAGRTSRLTVGIVGDSHIVRLSGDLLALEEEFGVEFAVRAQGGRGIEIPPYNATCLQCDVCLVVLGGNDLSDGNVPPEQLALNCVTKFKGIAPVVVFCSVWGRRDVDSFRRKYFNRELDHLTKGTDHLYHTMDKSLNRKLMADGIHLTPDGAYRLLRSLASALRRAL